MARPEERIEIACLRLFPVEVEESKWKERGEVKFSSMQGIVCELQRLTTEIRSTRSVTQFV